MVIQVRAYQETDIPDMVEIWNQVIEEGIAFPQEDYLTVDSGSSFFRSQTHCGIAVDSATGRCVGLYILHPNNVGRCAQIGNASYAVLRDLRGGHIGEKLVLDSLEQAKLYGFQVMQFNAVVASNVHARHLYERTGFQTLGIIPRGFRMNDGSLEDICLYYYDLQGEE